MMAWNFRYSPNPASSLIFAIGAVPSYNGIVPLWCPSGRRTNLQ